MTGAPEPASPITHERVSGARVLAALGAVLYEAHLPRSQALESVCKKMGYSSLDYILTGGEDYELLFNLKREDAKKIKRLFLKAHTPASLIGEVTSSSGKIILEGENGGRRNLKPSAGFTHFKGNHRQ